MAGISFGKKAALTANSSKQRNRAPLLNDLRKVETVLDAIDIELRHSVVVSSFYITRPLEFRIRSIVDFLAKSVKNPQLEKSQVQCGAQREIIIDSIAIRCKGIGKKYNIQAADVSQIVLRQEALPTSIYGGITKRNPKTVHTSIITANIAISKRIVIATRYIRATGNRGHCDTAAASIIPNFHSIITVTVITGLRQDNFPLARLTDDGRIAGI
jgi:hypothetical protein